MESLVGLRPVAAGPDLGPASIDSSDTTGEVAVAMLRRHTATVLALIEPVGATFDPGTLHDLRVAIRRSRAVVRVFHAAFPARADRLHRELGWLAGVLGAIRDLDVLIARVDATPPDGDEERRAIERLLSELERRRTSARRGLVRALQTKRFERLRALMADVARSAPPRKAAALEPIAEAGPALLDAAHRRVEAAVVAGEQAPDEALHRLRIRVKRLRYTVEFLVPVYGKPARAFASRATRIQDVLGAHQDSVVAVSALRELAATRRLPPAAAFEAGRLAERWRRQALRARRDFADSAGILSGRRWDKLREAADALRRSAEPPASTTDAAHRAG